MTDTITASEENASRADLLPVRMLNEYVYCPRLFHLMHVERRWADNVYTVEGRHVHRRVDKLDHVLPDADADHSDRDADVASADGNGGADDGDDPPVVTRSVPLSSDALGLCAAQSPPAA